MICPKCHAENSVKNGKALGKQRHKCKACGYQFTREKRHGKPQALKGLALTLYSAGISMTETAQILGISTQSVSRWLKNYSKSTDDVKVERLSKFSPRHLLSNDALLKIDDNYFLSGEVYALALRLSSGTRIDLTVKRPKK